MMTSSYLRTAKIPFEPIPAVVKKNERRVKSAKEGRRNHQQNHEVLKDRPRSSVPLSGERSRVTGKPPSGRTVRVLTGQNLTLKLDSAVTSRQSIKNDKLPLHESENTIKSVERTVSSSPAQRGQDAVRIPSGIAELAPWLTPNISQRLIGVDPSSCLVFLPTLVDCTDVPVVPPPQDARDPLQYTSVKREEKQFDPKKLFHYNVSKNRPHSADHVCDHRRKERDIQTICSSDGEWVHHESNYQANRTKEIIEREIKDLERLLQGMGCEVSDNVIVRYQHDINTLQRTVKKTLAEYDRPKEKLEPPQDLTGLKVYLKEKEKIIQRIRERRKKCIEELERLEDYDFGIKVTAVTR